MKFFVNPAKGAKKKTAAKRRRTSLKRSASTKAKARSGAQRTARKTTRSVTRRVTSMAKKAKRRAHAKRRVSTTPVARKVTRRRRRSTRRAVGVGVVHHNPRRRVRRSTYRRNPGGAKLSVKSIGATLVKGATDAATIVAGKAATNVIARVIPGGSSVPLTLAKQVIGALAVGMAGSKFLGRERGALLLAGGLTAPIESFIKGMNLPIVSAALGDDMIGEAAMGAYLNGTDMGSYYVEPAAPVAALPASRSGVGDDYSGEYYYGR